MYSIRSCPLVSLFAFSGGIERGVEEREREIDRDGKGGRERLVVWQMLLLCVNRSTSQGTDAVIIPSFAYLRSMDML